jgi:AbrB family looped-hinge helix DNA binding protein
MTRMTVGPKGQVVIPKQIREKVGLREGSDVNVDLRGDEVIIKRVAPGDNRSYVDFFISTRSKKLKKEVDIKRLLEEEKFERTRLS